VSVPRRWKSGGCEEAEARWHLPWFLRTPSCTLARGKERKVRGIKTHKLVLHLGKRLG